MRNPYSILCMILTASLMMLQSCDYSKKIQGVYKLDMDASIDQLKQAAEDRVPGRILGALMLAMVSAGDFFVVIEEKEIHLVLGKQFFSTDYRIKDRRIVLDWGDEPLMISTKDGMVVLHKDNKDQLLPISMQRVKDDKAYKEKFEKLR